MSNNTSEQVLDLLCNLYNRKDSPTWFQVGSDFSILAAEIWQRWHQDTSELEIDTIHPIAEKIQNQTWLSQLELEKGQRA